MKTAISIPDPVFQAAEKYAKHMRKSRSQLFSEAMIELLGKANVAETREEAEGILKLIGDIGQMTESYGSNFSGRECYLHIREELDGTGEFQYRIMTL